MESAVRAHIEDPDRITSVRHRARSLLEERFSAAALAKQYVAFFEELIERNAKRKRRS